MLELKEAIKFFKQIRNERKTTKLKRRISELLSQRYSFQCSSNGQAHTNFHANMHGKLLQRCDDAILLNNTQPSKCNMCRQVYGNCCSTHVTSSTVIKQMSL